MIGATIGTIRGARVAGAGRELLPGTGPVDLFVAGGRIADIAPAGVVPPAGEVLDAHGGWLLPGLWDHHVHVSPWALRAGRVDLGGARTAAQAAAIMGRAEPREGRRVGTGFRDGLWPDVPDLALLDAATGEVPTYLINADVHSIWLNSAALRLERLHPDDSGMLREEPAFEVSRRLDAVDPAVGDRLVAAMAGSAAARGVVGIVDLDMTWSHEAWRRRAEAGFDTLRVSHGVYPEHLERAIAEGMRTGDPVPGSADGLVRTGPLKVITDGSLGTRTAACSHPYPGDPHDHGVLAVPPAELVALLNRATGAGIDCAVHAIGDVANSHALDAFAATGASGTIEHAQLVSHADIPRFARLGVAASVQPRHALDDRDLTDTIWAGQTAMPYPLRALADARANVRFGSDAPVSPLDPWAAIAAAVFRAHDGREPWQADQRVDVDTALAASTRGGSTAGARIEPGAVADLVLCEADPRAVDRAGMQAMRVATTMIAGRVTHHAG